MTGRINFSFDSVFSLVEGNPNTDVDGEAETTLAFSVEAESMVLDPRLSTSVDYLPRNEIARGGMVGVFAADDDFLDRAVALKISPVKRKKEDAQFLREAKVVSHPAGTNIVPVHHLGWDSGGSRRTTDESRMGAIRDSRLLEIPGSF